jgi:hypothetical protein
VSAPRAARPGRGAIALAALLLALTAAQAPAHVPEQATDTAKAPAPKRGGGFWMDADVGYGWLRLTSGQNLLNGQQLNGVLAAHGMAVTVAAGGSLSQNVLLGVQYQTWTASGGNAVDQRVRSLLAVVQWYPWAGLGLFVRAGTGVAQGPVEPDNVSASTAQGTGVAFGLGVGYDIPVTRHFGLSVQAATHVAAFGDITAGGQVSHDVIGIVNRIGLAVVYR